MRGEGLVLRPLVDKKYIYLIGHCIGRVWLVVSDIGEFLIDVGGNSLVSGTIVKYYLLVLILYSRSIGPHSIRLFPLSSHPPFMFTNQVH